MRSSSLLRLVWASYFGRSWRTVGADAAAVDLARRVRRDHVRARGGHRWRRRRRWPPPRCDTESLPGPRARCRGVRLPARAPSSRRARFWKVVPSRGPFPLVRGPWQRPQRAQAPSPEAPARAARILLRGHWACERVGVEQPLELGPQQLDRLALHRPQRRSNVRAQWVRRGGRAQRRSFTDAWNVVTESTSSQRCDERPRSAVGARGRAPRPTSGEGSGDPGQRRPPRHWPAPRRGRSPRRRTRRDRASDTARRWRTACRTPSRMPTRLGTRPRSATTTSGATR